MVEAASLRSRPAAAHAPEPVDEPLEGRLHELPHEPPDEPLHELSHEPLHELRPEPLHVPADAAPVDLDRAARAAEEFLTALGVSLTAEHLRATPQRMARAWAELLTPRPFELTTFPNEEDYDEIVLVRDVPVRSVCEHHLLPFSGRACVGYLPADRIVGLSKLARVVEHVAARPQTQERLTKQVADWLAEHLAPRAVGVVVRAEHSCMTLRGARAVGTSTVTSTLLGRFREDARSRQEFLALTGVGQHVGG